MENKLINYFLKITNLSVEEINVLTESMVIKSYQKNDFLVKEGQVETVSFFILEGFVRQYSVHDGNDITTNFYGEEQWVISLGNFEGKTAASFNLVCLEDTTVVIGDEQKAQQLFKQFPRFETISRQIMETVFMEQQSFLTTYITDKPEQRYLKLLKERPIIFQRAKQYDIATYIGVKPESLSRIRKKLQLKD